MVMNIIECHQATKIYSNNVTGVKDVSFSIKEGEFVYLLGASGSGKSTLIRLLSCQESLTKGKSIICGYDTSKLKKRDYYKIRREVGVVHQNYKLLQNKTVYENIAFVLESIDTLPEELDSNIRRALTLVELGDRAQCYPHELSGGEQQRLAIARAFINNPKVLIADEPTGNLDPRTSMEIFRLLYRINKGGTTIILATHDQDVIKNFQYRILTLEEGVLVSDQEQKERGSLQYDFRKKAYFIV
jgi:cell division transport system ATP-binding protein